MTDSDPLLIVTSASVDVPVPKEKIRKPEVLCRVIVRLDAPGPWIVRPWLTFKEAVVNTIVPVTVKLMVSPLVEVAIVSRKEPVPLSFRLVTKRVMLPRTGSPRSNSKATSRQH